MLGKIAAIMKKENSKINIPAEDYKNPKTIKENFENLVKEKARIEKNLELVANIGKIITSTLNISQILKGIEEQIVARFGYDGSTTSIVSKRNNALECISKTDTTLTEKEVNEAKERYKIDLKNGKGVGRECVLTGKIIIVDDADRDIRTNKKVLTKGIKKYVTIPIKFGDEIVGTFSVHYKTMKKKFDPKNIDLLEIIANFIGNAIHNAYEYRETEKKAIKSEEEAVTDELTGLYNYRGFRRYLDEIVEHVFNRDRDTVSLIITDIDFFKQYNDTYGHPKGNELLKQLAQIFRENSRENIRPDKKRKYNKDIISRYGGEEFAIILPYTRRDDALKLADRLRKLVKEAEFEGEEVLPLKDLTISMGIAELPYDAQDTRGLILRADQALYNSKRLGRNRISIYEEKVRSL